MTQVMSREIRLASHPKGLPTAANFTLAQSELQEIQDGQVLPDVHCSETENVGRESC